MKTSATKMCAWVNILRMWGRTGFPQDRSPFRNYFSLFHEMNLQDHHDKVVNDRDRGNNEMISMAGPCSENCLPFAPPHVTYFTPSNELTHAPTWLHVYNTLTTYLIIFSWFPAWDLTSFQFFRKNLRVLSSSTRNPKRRKQVLFLRSTSSSPITLGTMKLSSMKIFSSAVSSFPSSHSRRTEGKAVSASRDCNQSLLLLSSSESPNDNIHLQNVKRDIIVVESPPSLTSVLNQTGLDQLLLVLDAPLLLLGRRCLDAHARPSCWTPLQFLLIIKNQIYGPGEVITLKPSILGATWLFLQVKAPARLSAAIARGFFCWL